MTTLYILSFILLSFGTVMFLGLTPESITDDIMRLFAPEQTLRDKVLIAKNNVGYKNLVKLNSIGFVDGYYYKPRIDFKTLREHSEGLICLSACIAGQLPRLLRDGVPIRTYAAEGYWCDVGSPTAFRDCNLHFSGGETVRGENVVLGPNSRAEGSVLFSGVRTGERCVLEGCVVCENAVLGSGVQVRRGAVVGAGAQLRDGAQIHPNVRIAPGVIIGKSTLTRALKGFAPRSRAASYTLGSMLSSLGRTLSTT